MAHGGRLAVRSGCTTPYPGNVCQWGFRPLSVAENHHWSLGRDDTGSPVESRPLDDPPSQTSWLAYEESHPILFPEEHLAHHVWSLFNPGLDERGDSRGGRSHHVLD